MLYLKICTLNCNVTITIKRNVIEPRISLKTRQDERSFFRPCVQIETMSFKRLTAVENVFWIYNI